MKSIIYFMALMISPLALAAESDLSPTTEGAGPATTEAEAPATEVTPAETTSEPAGTTEQAGFSRGSVVRSIFTTAIQDREPIDKLNNSASDTEQVFYFTELRDMSGQTATHRWEYDGKVVAEVKFNVRGPRWRVWSSKSFVPNWAGDWKVSVVNGAGETISEEMISLSGIPAKNTPAQEAVMPAAESTPEATTTLESTPDIP